jgi:hypothetical protein
LSEQAQLLLLKSRLKQIRKDRRNATILSLAMSFLAALAIQVFWFDFIIGGLVWASIGILFALTVIRHYNMKEAQVLWQIEQLTRSRSPNARF